MAGERLAKITVEASFSLNDDVRANQTTHVRLRLAGAWVDYYRGPYTSQHEFVVPDPDDVQRDYVKQALQNLAALITLDVQARGLPYVVSDARDLGNDLSTNAPRIAFDVTATLYDPQLDLAFANQSADPSGFTVTANLATLQPIRVQQLVQPAGQYGSATGSIFLTAFGGNVTPFVFTWADAGPVGDTRQQLLAKTYVCVVSDQSGVSTTVTCVVTSDAQLLVLVQQTEDSITLSVSGGLPPYAVQWDDGPTDFQRLGLTAATYEGTVSDARGASQRVRVELAASRCYFSQNPVRLALDAGDGYRLDSTTKPNLSFVAEVWVEPVYLSGVFVQVGPSLEQPADLVGRTVFDVQALLDAFLSEHLPAVSGELVERADCLFRRFYLKSAEKYGTPPLPAALASAQQHYVLCGGLAEEAAVEGNWPAYQAAVQPFLTWEPNGQALLPQQPAYLYYQHLGAATSGEVWVRAYHLDGSAASAQRLATLADARRWEVYCLRVGPAALGLDGPQVSGYDLWVTDANGALLSESRHFVLSRAYYPEPRFLLYTNSLGGVNCLALLGDAKQSLEVVASEAARAAYVPDLGDVATLSRTGTTTLSLDTGPRRRAQLQADQDLLLSRRATLLRDGQYWPGRVAPASYVLKDAAAPLPRLTFDFVLARQRHFSPRLPAAVAGQAVTPVAGGEGGTP